MIIYYKIRFFLKTEAPSIFSTVNINYTLYNAIQFNTISDSPDSELIAGLVLDCIYKGQVTKITDGQSYENIQEFSFELFVVQLFINILCISWNCYFSHKADMTPSHDATSVFRSISPFVVNIASMMLMQEKRKSELTHKQNQPTALPNSHWLTYATSLNHSQFRTKTLVSKW